MRTAGEIFTDEFSLEAAGHRLQVRTLTHSHRAGGSSSPVLVFLHEGLGCIEMWRDFPAALVEATGCDGLLYDRWGHGGSDPLDVRRTLRYVHDEALIYLPEVLTRCQVDSAILIGHSDGGSIALIFAAQYGEWVRGIVTEAAHVFVEEITVAGIRAAVRTYETTELREKLTRYHGDKTEGLFRAWSDTWLSAEFRGWNIEECLARITCPVLVIQGENDEYGTRAQVEAIAGQVLGPSRALLIPDCAHIPHHQARRRVAEEVSRFVLKLCDGANLASAGSGASSPS